MSEPISDISLLILSQLNRSSIKEIEERISGVC